MLELCSPNIPNVYHKIITVVLLLSYDNNQILVFFNIINSTVDIILHFCIKIAFNFCITTRNFRYLKIWNVYHKNVKNFFGYTASYNFKIPACFLCNIPNFVVKSNTLGQDSGHSLIHFVPLVMLLWEEILNRFFKS